MGNKHSNEQCKNYYAAANTYNGFYSIFEKIFSPEKLRNIYILKGGPGCGKSTAIKRISEMALGKGYKVENYFCSSSPTSYDGVIIPELSTAILDGTAPHSVDPKYPAVCENIVNFGEAWDIAKAEIINQDIRKLTARKSDAYKRAYAYLSSCMSAREVKMNCLSSYLLEEKMAHAVERICTKIRFTKSNGKLSEVFTDCISGIGNVHLNTFERLSKTRYFIKDYANIAPVFLDYLTAALLGKGADITVALDPLYPGQYKGIWLSKDEISFTIYDDNFCLELDKKQIPYKIINTGRFCDAEKFKSNKVFYKYADKSENILMNGAIKQLALAANTHDEIEKSYYDITDYSLIDKITNNMIKKIF